MSEKYDRFDETSILGDSTNAPEERRKLDAGDALDKSVDESMKYYKIAKPRRITIRGRVTHDLGRYGND